MIDLCVLKNLHFQRAHNGLNTTLERWCRGMTFTMMEKDLDMTKITVEEEVIIRIYDISYLYNYEHKRGYTYQK